MRNGGDWKAAFAGSIPPVSVEAGGLCSLGGGIAVASGERMVVGVERKPAGAVHP